jgi:hypothetical protein
VNTRTSGRGYGAPGKEESSMGNKAWMLVWVGVAVSAVLCVYAAVVN